MQITRHVHALKIKFSLPMGSGRKMERFAYTYLICGEKSICVIDSGVAMASCEIFEYIRSLGRDPKEIEKLVLTHAHPDHIGGARWIKDFTGCEVLAHADAVDWIEDTELQARERPVPGFHSLVEGPVKVDRVLKHGDCIDLGEGDTLEVIHTPGHAAGHIALKNWRDGVLFSGDAIPQPGAMPVYEDVDESIRSLKRLMSTGNVNFLLSSWDEPCPGKGARARMQWALGTIHEIHDIVRSEMEEDDDMRALAERVAIRLGLPPFAINPIFITSIAAHAELIKNDCLCAI